MILPLVTGAPIKQVQKSPAKNRGLTNLTLRFTRLSTTSRENRSRTFAFLEMRRDAQKSQKSVLASRRGDRLTGFQLSKSVHDECGLAGARIVANEVATFCRVPKISSTIR